MTEVRRLGPQEWSVAFRTRAFVAVLGIPPLVFVSPFSWLARGLESGFPRTGRSYDDLDTARWVDRVLRRLPWPWNRTCLKRSAVIFYLLRSQGRDVVLNVGVKRENGALKAHAWLTRNTEPYLEPGGEDLTLLSVIATFGRGHK